MLTFLLYLGFCFHVLHAVIALSLAKGQHPRAAVLYALLHAACAAGALAAATGQP